MRYRSILLTIPFLLALAGVLAACSSDGLKAEYPDKARDEFYKDGSLLSSKGGSSLLGSNSNNADAAGISVNGYLWRAALDTVAFLPVTSADPFGGVILTDWYSAANAPQERVKLNVFIIGRELRADGVRVSVFRQTRQGEEWQEAVVAPDTARKLEDTILTRARQLRLQQVESTR